MHLPTWLAVPCPTCGAARFIWCANGGRPCDARIATLVEIHRCVIQGEPVIVMGPVTMMHTAAPQPRPKPFMTMPGFPA